MIEFLETGANKKICKKIFGTCMQKKKYFVTCASIKCKKKSFRTYVKKTFNKKYLFK